MKRLDLVKQEGKYMFVYNHNGHKITNEVGTNTVIIDGKQFQIKKPFDNINAFHKFCACTKLY